MTDHLKELSAEALEAVALEVHKDVWGDGNPDDWGPSFESCKKNYMVSVRDWAGYFIRSGSLIPADQGRVEELEASEALGSWLCAALDDENVCDEFKASITTWFEAGKPTLNYLDKIEELEAENARLKEALRPFAETLVAQVDVDLPQQDWRDEDYDTVVRIRTSHARRGLPDLSEDMTLAVGDFRNARATLSRKGEG